MGKWREYTRYREEIRDAIDAILLQKPKNLDEFLKLLQEEGYEIKRGKYIAVKGKGQKSFLRFRSLGAGYRDEDIIKKIAGEMEPSSKEKTTAHKKQEKKLTYAEYK